jgi:hypothetical protein
MFHIVSRLLHPAKGQLWVQRTSIHLLIIKWLNLAAVAIAFSQLKPKRHPQPLVWREIIARQ